MRERVARAHARSRRRSRPTASTPSSCSAWAARASRPRCCGARSARPASTCSTRRIPPRSARSRRRSISSGRCSSRRRSPARRWRRGRTRTTSGRRRESAATAFAAVTDPGSDARAARGGARLPRHVFHGEPTIGGRYSALSAFGIVPAALMGIDVDRLLANAERMADDCRLDDGEPGLRARAPQFGAGWHEGRDKICIRETAGRLRALGGAADRRVHRQAGEGAHPRAGRVAATAPTGRTPRRRSTIRTTLGAEFFRWEFAVAVAGAYLGSTRSTSRTSRPRRTRRTRCSPPARSRRSSRRAPSPSCSRGRRTDDYVCVQAFVEPSAGTTSGSPASCTTLRDRSGLVVTHGYGPRYLHSTGQLHKGGPNTGFPPGRGRGDELAIPDKPFGFRRLIRAQAAGDFASLKERGRRVARIRWRTLSLRAQARRRWRPRSIRSLRLRMLPASLSGLVFARSASRR